MRKYLSLFLCLVFCLSISISFSSCSGSDNISDDVDQADVVEDEPEAEEPVVEEPVAEESLDYTKEETYKDVFLSIVEEGDDVTNVQTSYNDGYCQIIFEPGNKGYLSDSAAVRDCLDIYVAYCNKLYGDNAPVSTVCFWEDYNGDMAVALEMTKEEFEHYDFSEMNPYIGEELSNDSALHVYWPDVDMKDVWTTEGKY